MNFYEFAHPMFITPSYQNINLYEEISCISNAKVSEHAEILFIYFFKFVRCFMAASVQHCKGVKFVIFFRLLSRLFGKLVIL